VRLDGVVTVVDAKHVMRHLDTRKEGFVSEAVEQIAYADRILLNKTDLVGTSALLTLYASACARVCARDLFVRWKGYI
jgi:G3E family GTPase